MERVKSRKHRKCIRFAPCWRAAFPLILSFPREGGRDALKSLCDRRLIFSGRVTHTKVCRTKIDHVGYPRAVNSGF